MHERKYVQNVHETDMILQARNQRFRTAATRNTPIKEATDTLTDEIRHLTGPKQKPTPWVETIEATEFAFGTWRAMNDQLGRLECRAWEALQ